MKISIVRYLLARKTLGEWNPEFLLTWMDRMERPDEQILARMPLAEAVITLMALVTTGEQLERIWDDNRGRCYDREITFESMLRLILDALTKHDGSGRRAVQTQRENESFEASAEAAYGKLRRMPLAVSEELLRVSTSSLKQIFPEWAEYVTPASLESFEIVKLDGKALKRVPRRLASTRGTSGGLLGGRALVALHWSTGLACAMKTHEDGEANDVKFVPDLVPVVRQEYPDPILWVGDRAFCDLTQPHHFQSRCGDRFLTRYHKKTKFYADETRPARTGRTHDGQVFIESWGHLGAPSNQHRLYVRRIEIQREKESNIVLITDLHDSQAYPADDLIWMYRQRWDIEQLFQKVTEVFHLKKLIGSSAKASVFQFSLCMLLHNLIQVVKAYIAEAAELEPDEISVHLLMKDVETHLKCWDLMIDVETTVHYYSAPPSPLGIQKQLQLILKDVWTERWRKSSQPNRTYKPPGKRQKSHGSVYRMEQAHHTQRERKKKRNKTTV